MNTLINSCAPPKKSTEKRKIQQKPQITKESKNELKRKIGFSQNKLNVLFLIKIFYIKNLKYIGTGYQHC